MEFRAHDRYLIGVCATDLVDPIAQLERHPQPPPEHTLPRLSSSAH